jgi:hypothetical protein
MQLAEISSRALRFFERRDHIVVPSASLLELITANHCLVCWRRKANRQTRTRRGVQPGSHYSLTILLGPPDDPLRVAHEWLVSDSPAVVQVRAGRRVGATPAAGLETRVIELRHLDDNLSWLLIGGDPQSKESRWHRCLVNLQP